MSLCLGREVMVKYACYMHSTCLLAPSCLLFQFITVTQMERHTWAHHGNTAPHSDDIGSIPMPGVRRGVTASLEPPTGTALGVQLSRITF